MDIKEFMQEVKPAARKSKLEPFQSDIMTLYQNGYNLNQILIFLERNNIQISKPGLQRFIKRISNHSPLKPTQQSQMIIKHDTQQSQKPSSDKPVPSWANGFNRDEMF
ncbi:hypothetical protein PT286_04450 [Neisseriaceae bacterium ESL0693]|nr:hypothetical protein [Neisseriaceae bacterium ESL0693]